MNAMVYLRGFACTVTAVFLSVSGAVYAVDPAPEANPKEPADPLRELRQKQERLTLENGVAEQQLRKELAGLTAEKQKLELENGIAQQKLQAEIAGLQGEIDKLNRQVDVLTKRAGLKDAERKTRLDAELADVREELEKIKAANELAGARFAAKQRDVTQHEEDLKVRAQEQAVERTEIDIQIAKINVEVAVKQRDLTQREQELRIRLADMQAQRAEFDNQLAKLNADLDLREKRDQWKNRVDHDIRYTKEPFQKGVLTISDRRIPLNDVITMDTADYIAERIDYFNNQNQEFPIFIVIDRSPGGSVMAGYKILKAMEGSPAPVYVVLKSFAASMAAGIVTLSRKSFAYPNAIMLHHQILSGSYGNLTEQKEQLKDLEEWWKRLASPIAVKMGIPLDEFIKRMYANRSSGDWQEFADSARKLKWLDEVIETVREESYIKNPDVTHPPATPGTATAGVKLASLQEQADQNGRRFVLLPRLDPVDCYYLYNPDNYYRLR